MKIIAAFMLVGVFCLGVTAASAKTVTVPQKDNDRVTAGVSGATPGKSEAGDAEPKGQAATTQPSKKELKASKIRTPPPMHDPN